MLIGAPQVHIYGMASREHWVENHRCPKCEKTGTTELSQMDDSFNIRVDSVLEGFSLTESEKSLIQKVAGEVLSESVTG
jgi:hypothetical protein